MGIDRSQEAYTTDQYGIAGEHARDVAPSSMYRARAEGKHCGNDTILVRRHLEV